MKKYVLIKTSKCKGIVMSSYICEIGEYHGCYYSSSHLRDALKFDKIIDALNALDSVQENNGDIVTLLEIEFDL